MNSARSAAVLTWVYTAAFGIPAIPVSVFLLQRGRLPNLWGLFDVYGGAWSSWFSHDTFVALLIAFLIVTLLAAWAAWLVWKGSKAGAMINLVALPVEAAFWLGFGLPLPWLFGIARAAFLVRAWNSLNWRGIRSRPGRTSEAN